PGLGGRAAQTFGANGQAYRSYYETTNKLLETFFTWDRKFGDHTIKALLGYSWQDNVNGNGFQAETYNFPVDNIGYNNFALSAPYAVTGGPNLNFGPDGLYQETKFISDYARVNYSFRDKYLFQGSLRRDGSSVFGANHQWGYFPAVSAGWRISKEEFMKGQTLFDDLKIRGGYGVVGNAFGFSAYTAQSFSGLLGTFYSNGSQVNAYGPIQAANPDLQWEKTATTDIGVDFSMLRGRLSGSVDVYDKTTTQMILNYQVNPFDIYNRSIYANGGGVSNKGIELSLTATPVVSGDFTWTTTLNASHNVNKITSLNNPLFPTIDSIPVAEPDGTGQSG
ncbi:MAG TPA: TonB-dependent receptor, partial [Puia sp.]|nr:TonB-dependent receptor [Puia sp.]